MPERADEPPFVSNDDWAPDHPHQPECRCAKCECDRHPPFGIDPPFVCTCDYECEGRTDDTDCPEHGRRDGPPAESLMLVGDYSDGPVTYTITAATVDGVPVEPDLADLFDLVLDRLGGSPCDE